SRLPPGVMFVDAEDRPHLVLDNVLAPWTPGGYGSAGQKPRGATVRVLTPRSIVRAIDAGYPVGIHPSAAGERDRGEVGSIGSPRPRIATGISGVKPRKTRFCNRQNVRAPQRPHQTGPR